MSNAVAILHREEILEQLKSGMLLKEIAAQYGVTKQAIWAPLKDDPEYHSALVEQADALIEQAKEETWAAREALDIARAREIARYAFRYAESINPAKWARQERLQVEFVGDLGDRLRRSRERVIEHESGVELGVEQPAVASLVDKSNT